MMILLKFMVERYFSTNDEFKLNIEQEIVGNNTKEVVESSRYRVKKENKNYIKPKNHIFLRKTNLKEELVPILSLLKLTSFRVRILICHS